MIQESVVYGCIKDLLLSDNTQEAQQHRLNNQKVMMSLPSIEDWPLLSREMFSMPVQVVSGDDAHTDVMHFGTSYKGVEHEWEMWIQKFESMLKSMYWVSATVHLETEYNGRHTFTWEPESSFHEPNEDKLSVRCEWSRESVSF
ncbi:MAG: hypothetical protein WCY88_08945 [Spongiibacteraceae bacterium]